MIENCQLHIYFRGGEIRQANSAFLQLCGLWGGAGPLRGTA